MNLFNSFVYRYAVSILLSILDRYTVNITVNRVKVYHFKLVFRYRLEENMAKLFTCSSLSKLFTHPLSHSR